MSRSSGQSEARPTVFKSSSKLGTHLSTHCMIEFPTRQQNIFHKQATFFSRERLSGFDSCVLCDSLWFINVNEQDEKKAGRHLQSLLDKVETDQAMKGLDEVMDINHDSENKFQKSEENETFELKGKFSNAA
ncbi:hypothetical protein TNCV_1690051 [Trichonephila clavipes]|nr:hypothetical protein TNCV_1690051 [Trichonephila clavipes]